MQYLLLYPIQHDRKYEDKRDGSSQALCSVCLAGSSKSLTLSLYSSSFRLQFGHNFLSYTFLEASE